MDRHLLIAVSDQKASMHGIRFACNFFGDKQPVKSTFFYSSPAPPAVWGTEKSLETDQWQKEQARKLMNSGKQAVEAAVKESVRAGFPKDNLFQKLQTKVFSKVADIIQEGEKGSYDAVVLGRRGITMLEAAFEESVSKSLFEETFTFPLWLCRSSNPERRNILFHADGSQTSFAMADHIGFMACTENRHRVDIVPTDGTARQASLKDRYADALQKHGIAGDRIRWMPPAKGDLAGSLIETAGKGAYAAVAVGRSNQGKGVLSRLFKGPVCSALFKDLKDAALWVCH